MTQHPYCIPHSGDNLYSIERGTGLKGVPERRKEGFVEKRALVNGKRRDEKNERTLHRGRESWKE